MQTFVAKLAQIRFARLALRGGVLRIFRDTEFQFEINPIGNHQGVCDRLGVFRKQRPHFVGRLEVKFGRIPHSALVVHHLPGADANHHVMRLVVAALEKVDVVRGDETEAELLSEARQHLVTLLLHLDAVIVHLEEKILRAENVAEPGDALPRLGEIVRLDRHVDLALEASAQSDEAGGMFRE